MQEELASASQISPGLIHGVPDRLEGWEDDFTVPKQFSDVVMVALTTGRVSSNVRAQIIQDVATKMLSYCKYPTATQSVAHKLISQFPMLKDSIGIGHVS